MNCKWGGIWIDNGNADTTSETKCSCKFYRGKGTYKVNGRIHVSHI